VDQAAARSEFLLHDPLMRRLPPSQLSYCCEVLVMLRLSQTVLFAEGVVADRAGARSEFSIA
jgi:hypothetical protein